MAQVVHLYYQRNLSQKEIADRFGISKMTVSRALKRAEQTGLVQVKLNLPVTNVPDLEAALVRRLGLQEAFVVNGPEPGETVDGEQVRDILGRSTAFYVDSLLQPGTVFGVALGRTLSRVVHHLRDRQLGDAKVVQVMGGLDVSSDYNPYDIIQRLSQRLGAKGFYFSGTAFVANASVQKAMLEQNTHAGLRELWKQCDICFTGIGDTSKGIPYVRSGLVSERELEEIVGLGAVGDLLGRYYDIDGRFLDSHLNQRVNAVPLEDLSSMGRVLVTAGGPGKVKPIIGLGRTKIPISLVTDRATASGVLQELDRGKRATPRN